VRYVHTELGLNSRLDELQAAVLSVRLELLDEWTVARRGVARRYAAGIQNPLVEVLPLPAEPERHVHHLFVVRTERRDELRDHLATAGVECLSHYPIPIHHQAPTADVRIDPEGLGTAERHAAGCVSLPCHPYLVDAEVDRVIEAVNSFRP
jgi:dTDP-4-amino-4,6-dideoxygalactose transaminase